MLNDRKSKKKYELSQIWNHSSSVYMLFVSKKGNNVLDPIRQRRVLMTQTMIHISMSRRMLSEKLVLCGLQINWEKLACKKLLQQ